ncbi:single-stranded DNA-binding protein, partial [Paralysiella testudinis]
EIAGQYLRKGGLVYIDGRIQSRKYTGKDGVERTAYEIIGNEMKMLGSKELGVKAANRPAEEAQPQATPSAMPPVGGQSSQRPAPVPVDDIDDDIPF